MLAPRPLHRQTGLGAIQCLYLSLLIHTQHQRMLWRMRYNPTMASSLSAKFGSLMTLKLSVRCGFRPLARQMRDTEVNMV